MVLLGLSEVLFYKCVAARIFLPCFIRFCSCTAETLHINGQAEANKYFCIVLKQP
jgi:hypothetical protein